MRAFMMAVAAAIVAFVGRYAVDQTWQQTADQEFNSSTNVRLSHAGHNLVGKDWSSAKEH